MKLDSIVYYLPMIPLTPTSLPGLKNYGTFNKTVSRHLYCSLKPHAQTGRQTHKHATKNTGSPRLSPLFCQVSTLYAFLI